MSEDMSPEQKHTPNSESKETQSQIRDWTTDVKRQIEHGNASVFVHARVDFDIEETGVGQKLVKTRFEGYKNFLLRNTTGEIADEIKGIMDAAVRQGDKEAEDDLVLPREHSRKEDTLYISIVNPLHFLNKTPIARKYAETAMQYAGNKDIVEVRYKQPKADKYDRTSEKIIYMVLPMEESQALQSIIRQGVDANEVRDSLASIFVDEKYRDLFDANLVDVSKGEVVKQAEKPSLNKISLGVSQASGEARFVPGKIEIIDSIPSNKNKSAISDTAGINPDAGQAPGVQAEEINMLLDSIEESANPSDKFSFDPVEGEGGEPENETKSGKANLDPESEEIQEILDLFRKSANPSDKFPFDPVEGEGGEPENETKSGEANYVFKEETIPFVTPEADLLRAPEKQLEWARSLLDQIETTGQNTLSIANAANFSQLMGVYEKLDSRIQSEIRLRLDLHDTDLEFRGAASKGGSKKIEGNDVNLFAQAVTDLRERRRFFDDQDYLAIKRDHIGIRHEEKIPVARAFSLLERVALQGIKMNNTSGPVRLYSLEANQNVKKQIREIIAQEIARVEGISILLARKSVELAEKTAWATGDVAVWDVEFTTGHPMARLVHFRGYREGKGPEEDPGPRYTVDKIESIGTSYSRMAKIGRDRNFLYNPRSVNLKIDPEKDRKKMIKVKVYEGKIRTEREVSMYESERKVLSRRRGFVSPEQGVNIVNINELPVELTGGDSLYLYWTLEVPQIMDLGRFLTKSELKPDDLDADDIERVVSWIKKAQLDPTENIGEKAVWGVVTSLFGQKNELFPFGKMRRAGELGWDSARWRLTSQRMVEKGLVSKASMAKINRKMGLTKMGLRGFLHDLTGGAYVK